eukprot:g5341.t1
MHRSSGLPFDKSDQSHFPNKTPTEERKRQRRHESSSGSKRDEFVGSDDEDDKTNSGYFTSIIMDIFQTQLPSKIKVRLSTRFRNPSLYSQSELLPAAIDLDATVRNLQLQAEQVSAALEAEENAAKEEEEKAKIKLTSVHESVLQAINSLQETNPSHDSDSPSP